MIRSFHYCSRVGQSNMLKPGMGAPEDMPARYCRTALVLNDQRGFLRVSRRGGQGSIPTAYTRRHPGLLHIHLLEKVCYELRYELNNRPDWVEVPMQGILQLE